MKLIISMFAALMLVINPGYAKQHGACDYRGKFKEMMQKLELSDSQKEQIKKIMKARRDYRMQMRGKMKELRQKLKDVAMQEKYDAQKVADLVKQKTDMMADRMKTRIESKHKIYSLLTPEQKQKYKDMKEKMRSYYKECRAKK